MNSDRENVGRWLAEAWAALFQDALESAGGERPDLACTPSAAGTTVAAVAREIDGEILWWEQSLSLPGEPALWIGAPQAAWTRLVAPVPGAAEVEAQDRARQRYLEILQQSLNELALKAGQKWNLEIAFPPGAERPDPPQAELFYLVQPTVPDAAVPPLLVAICGEPEPPTARTSHPGAPQIANSKTFDLLMDVELPVSVSFGRVQIPLKEVLKLTAGSIIELNRMVDEPVEVIVNNCVVARGEVVTVEGNYGVRIHQIMSRKERLESLP